LLRSATAFPEPTTTKVTRNALQNAASVAALILTTDCMIAKTPQKRSAAAPPDDMGM